MVEDASHLAAGPVTVDLAEATRSHFRDRPLVTFALDSAKADMFRVAAAIVVVA